MDQKLSHREFYAPGHFGNSYEVTGEYEMFDYLREAKYWGFNWYSDWFDSAGLVAPWNEEKSCEYSSIIWNRKKMFFKFAHSLGMKTGLTITPNHVFADQVSSQNAARKEKGRIFGQLVCPGTPDGKKVILDNFRWLFKDMADSGVVIESIKSAPYDYGGCACKKCQPWILTFARLTKRIYEIAKKFYPGIKLDLIGWWWKPEEHELFNKWADKYAEGWINSMSLHILYGKDEPNQVLLPKGCKRRAFVHTGYGESRSEEGISDIYGLWGPVIGAERLHRTLENLKHNGHEGFMSYSEGFFQDVNNALIAGLSSGKFTNPNDVLEEYARRYFGANNKKAKQWAKLLIQFGDLSKLNLSQVQRKFEKLGKNAVQTWRLEQWRSKIRLLTLHHKISRIKDWPKKRLELVRKWQRETEYMRRQIYGLGVMRHVFQEHYCGASWYHEWQAVQKKAVEKLQKEQ